MRVIKEAMGQSNKARRGGEWGRPKHKDKKAGSKRGRKEDKESKEELPDEDEEVLISKFIQSLSADNYSAAHKYLRGIVNNKIQNRIATAANKPFFN